MKKVISAMLVAIMLLSLMAGIICFPSSALNPADFGKVTLWSDKTVYEVGDPIMVQGSVEFSPLAPTWIGLIVRNHSEWGGLRWVWAKDTAAGPLDLAAGSAGGNHNLAPYQSLPAGEYTIVIVPNDLPLAGDVNRKENILMSIDIEIVEKKAPLSKAPTGATYEIKDPTSSLADGDITVELPADHGAASVQAFWGTKDGKLAGYTGLAPVEVGATETTAVGEMVKNTIIPPEATHILFYTVNATGQLSEDYFSVALPEGCNFKMPDGEPLIEFQAVSDIHISTEIREQHYIAMLQDIAKNSPNSAGIFVAGDSVDSGPRDDWWQKLWALYDEVEGLPHMYLGIGNHEFSGYSDYDSAINQFLKYLRLPDTVEKEDGVPYYDTWIDDYHFIVLGNAVYEPGVRATIGEEQYAWLESKLAEATDDTPIFLFMHQGMKNTVSGTAESEKWWGINDDAKLRQLLKKYPNVFFFTGHTHSLMDWANCMYGGGDNAALFNTASVADLWVPSTGEMLVGSQGYYVQVYKDKVLVRGRDFVTGEWVASAQFVVNDRFSGKPSTADLKLMISEVEKLNNADYTEESWATLADALAAAKTAVDSAKRQEEVDSALAALEAAKKALITKPADETPDKTPDETPDKTPEGTPDNKPGDETPNASTEKSGCSSALSVGAIALIATTGAAVITLKKRKEN